MLEHTFRPFDDKAELERELMDADYRFAKAEEVGELREDTEEETDVPHLRLGTKAAA